MCLKLNFYFKIDILELYWEIAGLLGAYGVVQVAHIYIYIYVAVYIHCLWNKCDIKPTVVILDKIAVYNTCGYGLGLRLGCNIRWPGAFIMLWSLFNEL